MLPHSIDTGLLRDLAAWTAFALTLSVMLWWRSPLPLSRRGVVTAGLIWLALWSFEYWAGGPYSFVYFNDEGELSLPLAIHHFRWGDGGNFDWAIAGGIDFRSVLPNMGQKVGLENILFTLLPAWPALLLHKLAVGSVSLYGAYLLCRRGVGAERGLSIALAALYSVGHAYLLQATLNHGLGYALIPLAITVLSVAAGKPGYWKGVLGFAAVLALSTSPLHSLPSLIAAVALWTLAFSPRQIPTVAVSIVVMVLVLAPNWFDTVRTFLAYAGLSPRGEVVIASLNAADFFYDTWDFFRRLGRGIYLGVVLVLPLLLLRRDRWAWKMLALLVGTLFLGPILNAIPWSAMGLRMIGAYEFNRIMFAIPAFGCAALAGALPILGRFRPLGRWPFALALALAMLSLSVYKVQNFVSWLGLGGVGNLTDVPNLKDRPWAPAEPFRVVTLPFKLLPDTPLAYGLETLDGYVMLLPRPIFTYWNEMLLNPDNPLRRRPSHNGLYMADPAKVDFRGMQTARLGDFVDVDKLRLGNVGFVISALPLVDENLTKVSGPETGGTDGVVRRSKPFRQKLEEDLRDIFSPPPAYIYALENPLPRAYFAASVVGVPSVQVVEKTAQLALSGVAVIDGKDQDALATTQTTAARVVGHDRGPDRLAIRVEAPSGGVLVLNQQYLPFWHADIDGQAAPIISANIIHMAVRIPAGAKEVVFSYNGSSGSKISR